MAESGLTSTALTSEDLNKIGVITRKWARKKKAELIASVIRAGLVDTGKLRDSIRSGVRTRYGEAHTIWFKYEWYGLFHDVGSTGVGRQKMNLPAKHWMARLISGDQLSELTEELSGFYAELAIKSINIEIKNSYGKNG